ncbi:two-component system, sensor histidine kinase YesM [Gracilibacillus orientalis]|uniref:histidine kinase n=1 Tax=Gracilibacillus orientalis TaxID=334253 RepID=A0A1I4P1J9_9BACI|nr:sensor histidine kinase [Gracilibacillus orientalis]SFM21233.1 two-component system, sensor histidine kinase YesM [Gracilibacillus orientalis]
MIRKIRQIYMDLRLKYKMVILTSLVLLAFSIGGLSILQYAFQKYNNEIYRQSAQAIQVSTNSVEAELKKMERLSYQISTDMYVQAYLQELNNTDSNYNKFTIGMELRKRLISIGALNKYVQSMQVYDRNDKEYASGNLIIKLSKDRLNTMKENAAEEEGGVSWVSSSEEDPTLIATREVREYMDFSFEQLGTIGVRVDIQEIVHDLTNNLEEQKTSFLIFDSEDRRIFSNNSQVENIYPSQYKQGEQGYQIVKYKGERFFLTYSDENHLGWTYMILTPYNNLFNVITQTRTAVFLTYFGLFLLMIFLGSKFTGTIVNPIESLNRKMKKVQTGKFDYDDSDLKPKYPRDEAGQMHENFQIMMQQINDLIVENYKKQLLIKESEYKTLQAQVNPHFLYNTLESINWSAKIAGEKKISQMAESLGYVLRASINMKGAFVTLAEEVAIVEHYITIQSFRFEERLDFRKNIPPKYDEVLIPKSIIQPIVENSIRYGLQEMIGVCTIKVEVEEINEDLLISVSDNGPGMEEDYLNKIMTGDYQPKGTGIGLKNIEERIKILFGESYGIYIESVENQGTKVIIKVPKKGETTYVQSVVSG